MKCLICKVEMERGCLHGHGSAWLSRPQAKGQKFIKIMWGAKDTVIAWKCPTCKKIELTSE